MQSRGSFANCEQSGTSKVIMHYLGLFKLTLNNDCKSCTLILKGPLFWESLGVPIKDLFKLSSNPPVPKLAKQ